MNKWFKKFPYPGWLIVIAVMLITSMALYRFDQQSYSHKELAASVQKEFSRQEAAVLSDQKAGRFYEILKSDHTPALPTNYFFYVAKDTFCFIWNTSVVDMPSDVKLHPSNYLNGKLRKLVKGYFYLKTWALPKLDTSSSVYYALTTIPVFYDYPLDNQYFQSHFQAGPKVPTTTLVLEHYEKDSYPIYGNNNKPVFFLKFLQAPDEYYTAGWLTWLCSILTCLSIVFWIHECCYGIGIKTKKPLLGFAILLFLVLVANWLLKSLEFPIGFQNSKIFSPELYSSTKGVKSFGNLMIGVFSDTWCLIYLVAYIEINKLRFTNRKIIDRAVRILLILGIVIYLHSNAIAIVAQMIRDSKISFDAGNYASLNIFTIIGVLTVIAITVNILLLLGVINGLLLGVAKHLYFKFLIVLSLLGSLLFLLFPEVFNWVYFFFLFLTLCSMYLVEKYGFPLKKRRIQNDLKIASSTYVWFAILCSWVTVEIFYFNYEKELELRKVFAHKQEQKSNGQTAFKFITLMDDLQKDSIVNVYFKDMDDSLVKSNVSQYVNHVYFEDYAKKFNIGVYFYDKQRKPVLAEDTLDMALLKYADSINKEPFKYGLVDVENIKGGDYIYWFLSPFLNPEQTDTMGYIGFNIYADKKFRKGNTEPFLSVRNNATDEQYYSNYSYGIYYNTHLWTQKGDIVFPSILKDTIGKKDIRFLNNTNFSSSLLYRSSKNEVIKVIYTRNIITNVISLFSYVLGLLLLLSGVVFLGRYFIFYPGRIKLAYKNFSLTIRSKVNVTILVTVFLSLFTVGFITLSFLTTRYRETQQKNLQNILMFYTQYITYTAEESGLDFETMKSNRFSTYSAFSYKMSQLAEEQGAEVNIYNLNGRVIASSQIGLYKDDLLSRFMDYSILSTLRKNDLNEAIKTESIGGLEYQGIYAPIRNKYDKVVAYMNIPYYASGKELTKEISSVVVTLVNVYALVFFLSGLFAIFISNSIIRSFRLLIDQFRNIRLHHNEYIHWPHRDEIALLVNEYNSMMKKVEMMASRLARTEREAAWRDIARQVAHEIKNPLTPMKLNIQYLQQAIASNRPDIEKLASKVANVLIEQIENLNIIASEFSNFAKMPDATPENLKIQESLLTLVELFQKNNEAQFEFITKEDKLTVYMDKGYFIRVFTNLIQNAIQSIETGSNGKIIISYEQNDHDIVIAIADNGAGIPLELQGKLFQPYFTTKTSGTGLGLPMTKNLVENSEGAIWFETMENKGTTFFVRLPIGES